MKQGGVFTNNVNTLQRMVNCSRKKLDVFRFPRVSYTSNYAALLGCCRWAVTSRKMLAFKVVALCCYTHIQELSVCGVGSMERWYERHIVHE